MRRRVALAASLFGVRALLAFIACRGQRLELSSTPLSDAPSAHQHGVQDRSPGDRVAFYVYDDVPELDHSGLIQCYRDRHDGVPPWQDEGVERAQNMGELWAHRAILEHPWRVLDPEQADVFYIPMYPALSYLLELGGRKPTARFDQTRIDENRCEGLTHTDRMNVAVKYLSRSSPFFNRFGGADHVLVCAYWSCSRALQNYHRMILRRTVIGINENKNKWHRWGCGSGRVVTVPYVASSVLTTSSNIGGRPPEDRDIPFFFVGTARGREERANLDVVQKISADSVIFVAGRGRRWTMNATVYANHIARSRFCLCPRGDSRSSRRLFDALAAGCIPILSEIEMEVVPYVGTGFNYSQFTIVSHAAFASRQEVNNTIANVLARSEEELAELRNGARTAMSSLLYGVTRGDKISDMHPFREPATKLLRATYALAGEAAKGNISMWDCQAIPTEAQLAPRTHVEFPPVPGTRRQWLAESETIVNKDRSLLFCAPPNAGSLQLRMLAKRMQGISHWRVSDDRELLFDPTASELELLDITDGDLMTKIYRDNDSGWIKIAVVRDPVTRLLSAYLDIVRTWRAGLHKKQEPQSPPSSPALQISDGSAQQAPDHGRQRQLGPLRHTADDDKGARYDERDDRRETTPLGGTSNEWELLDAILARRKRQQGGTTTRDTDEKFEKRSRGGSESNHAITEGESRPVSWEGSRGGLGSPDAGASRRLAGGQRVPEYIIARYAEDLFVGGDAVRIPTLAEVVDALKGGLPKAPAAFMPAVSLCGQLNSPFDSVIPFERLQNTSTEVFKSLPGGIWEAFGASGWGPDGKHAFMEFDYGGAAWHGRVGVDTEDDAEQARGRERNPVPRRASDLFEGESCAWAEYYGDVETLESAIQLYMLDYSHFRWYRPLSWRKRLQRCIDRGTHFR